MIPYGPTDGHPLNNQWASTEQASGTHCQHGGATNAQLLDLFWALSFLFPISIQRKHNEECLHQLSQMGKLKNLKKLEKLKPYALQIDIQPKRLLAITSNDLRE